jgi:EAL domain-containing protein (putative c-di-GMP-specific phosphodiesterase class I)
MMDDAASIIDTLQQLCDLGVELCIDDFGTGYSSLRYLQRFPVQTVKIDHSFVTHLGKESTSESTHIVKAILLMAHALGMNVIAEWIETPDQLAQLEAMGCEYGQGYLFSRPVSAEEAGAMLVHINETFYAG